MVELKKKYQIGTRRFGLINWVGTYSLFKKEVLRFLTVSGQTLFGPILTSILFLTVISLALGDLVVKFFMALSMLIPFRLLLSSIKSI